MQNILPLCVAVAFCALEISGHCTKAIVANALGVSEDNIDYFCNPDEWFHGRINRHVKLSNFCGCQGAYDHDVYCTVLNEVEVENGLSCAGMPLPDPTPRLIEIREESAKQEALKLAELEAHQAIIKAEEDSKREQETKHVDEQEVKRKRIEKHEESEKERLKKYEEEEKTFVEEAMANSEDAQRRVEEFVAGDVDMEEGEKMVEEDEKMVEEDEKMVEEDETMVEEDEKMVEDWGNHGLDIPQHPSNNDEMAAMAEAERIASSLPDTL